MFKSINIVQININRNWCHLMIKHKYHRHIPFFFYNWWLSLANILTKVRPIVVSWEKIRNKKSQFWLTSAMLGTIKYLPVVVLNNKDTSRRLTFVFWKILLMMIDN